MVMLKRQITITEIESTIPTITALTVVENKISNISSLVKKTDYNTKKILKLKRTFY